MNIKHNVDSIFYIHTKYNSPNGRIIKMNIFNKNRDAWKDVIPENEKILHSSKIVNTNQLLLTYKNHLIHELSLYSLEGEYIKEILLPDLGSVRVSADWKDSNI